MVGLARQRLAVALNHGALRLPEGLLPNRQAEPVTKDEEGEIAYLFEVGYLSSVKRYAKAWSIVN